jgi:hypothetical protein
MRTGRSRTGVRHLCGVVWLALFAVGSAACGESSPSSPSAPPAPVPVPGGRSGPVEIAFVSATPVVGSTITGCGDRAAGCAGRIRMQFRLTSPMAGTVIGARSWLFASTRRACLAWEGGPFTLPVSPPPPGGVPLPITHTLDVLFDRADDCIVPTDLATMALVLEGPDGISSRQEWEIRYTLAR